MKLGLLSDSHGHTPRTVQAVRRLCEKGATVILHCGDVGTEEVLTAMAAETAGKVDAVYAVLGNVDRYDPALARYPEDGGILVRPRTHDLTLDGHRLAITHGDDTNLLVDLLHQGTYRYVFSGHTHVPHDERVGATRWINPGAIYRAQQPGFALLDLDTDGLLFLAL